VKEVAGEEAMELLEEEAEEVEESNEEKEVCLEPKVLPFNKCSLTMDIYLEDKSSSFSTPFKPC
jgi:hypothetical protein